MAKHVLILIHGITPEKEPNVTAQYEELVAAVGRAGLPIEQPICQVQWGVPGRDGSVTRPDQYLCAAEAFVASLMEESAGAAHGHFASRGRDWGIPLLRSAIGRVRENVVQYGLSDALYYAGPEGEQAVREAVFEQVFGKLEASENGELHLHIVAHSLGVTVAHDFLYALFGRHDASFPTQSESDDPYRLEAPTQQLKTKWRAEAESGRLKLGTFICFASQLPLFVMRKQALVERLARREKLDPSVIGIDKAREQLQWAIFYDEDELLGFPTASLYEPTRAIADLQMNSGVEPLAAHLGYWHKPQIIGTCIDLLRANMR